MYTIQQLEGGGVEEIEEEEYCQIFLSQIEQKVDILKSLTKLEVSFGMQNVFDQLKNSVVLNFLKHYASLLPSPEMSLSSASSC